MGDEIDREETKLRRRLLFRLLKSFDFDNPVLKEREVISAPLPPYLCSVSADAFHFNFAYH